MKGIDRIPLYGAVAILAAATVLGVFLTVRLSEWPILYLTAIGVVLFAGLLLSDYSHRPLAPRPAPPAALEKAMRERVDAAPDDAEFVDPVIEADKIASGEVLPEVADEDSPGPMAGP